MTTAKYQPRFETGVTVRVPAAVHDSLAAQIASREWREAGYLGCLSKHGTGWVYGLAFVFGGETFMATEDELSAWQV